MKNFGEGNDCKGIEGEPSLKIVNGDFIWISHGISRNRVFIFNKQLEYGITDKYYFHESIDGFPRTSWLWSPKSCHICILK